VTLNDRDCRLVTFSYLQESTAEFSAAGGKTEDDQDGDLIDEVCIETTEKNFIVFI
jgi:hypothetical protein